SGARRETVPSGAVALAVKAKQIGRDADCDLISFRVTIGAHGEPEHRKTITYFQTIGANLSSHYALASVLLSDSRTISIASTSSELAGIGPCSRSKLSTDADKVSPIILA